MLLAEKDEAGKDLESYNDVFADIVNDLLYDVIDASFIERQMVYQRVF